MNIPTLGTELLMVYTHSYGLEGTVCSHYSSRAAIPTGALQEF